MATPVSNHRGIVATSDGKGRDVVLIWLFDHRGGYACLVVDAITGETDEVPIPFEPGHDCPYASVLSSGNRYYTHFNSHFVEFDPHSRSFTFCHETAPKMSMGMTEDDDGCIWSISYPDSGLVRFNPATREFTDFGHVYKQNWPQYQRFIAADDRGWIYFAIGNTATQLIAFDPGTGATEPLLSDDERVEGATAFVERDQDGRVYALADSSEQDQSNWLQLYEGQRQEVGGHSSRDAKPIVTSSQALFHRTFPSGRQLVLCDTVEGELIVEDPATAQRWENHFEYTSEGAHLMGVAAAPNDTICGGTAFPMRFFQFDPPTGAWTNRASHGQWNTVARQGDRYFVGGYTGGFLLEWNPFATWVDTEPEQIDTNPRFLAASAPSINRPHALLAHPNGRHLVLGGTPGYGLTGGGILLWDRQEQKQVLREHHEWLPNHSVMSLVALDENRALGGSTVAPGTGGEARAQLAELFELDLNTMQVTWHAPVLDRVREYTDLALNSEGLLYGIADKTRFFVYDIEARSVLLEHATTDSLGESAYHQGPRLFLTDPETGTTFLLFHHCIARICGAPDYHLQKVSESPVPIHCGGDILAGRIYFGSGSHLYSYDIGDLS
ncbi:MAG: hypothetical protein HOM68_10030 [Gemmatimonadetes bacterium]|nr:hypothetical protein [Gemmatimonadota bacterium]MBT5056864.1 hypothetical protein [Gemmatimonadota bacterium]MBT5144034.1 hypothetical protein [Gemmatimonadota bacterium]MBT5590265.1 hypothetical protein [Gemmatimonadota bacterium]MBT5963727.1 hypothetical protein [Gemmatimonadota bacterium]